MFLLRSYADCFTALRAPCIVDGHRTHRAKQTRAFVESTEGKLQLFTLPSYSPELNPDELVWRHVKAHRVGRMGIRNRNELEAAVRVACAR
jgi:transposase